MYIPPAFREARPEVLHALMREYSFATLVSRCRGDLIASHLPLLLDAERGPFGTLVGHMARANPQWHAFGDGENALAIFHGPHAYVSPSWYTVPRSVPTWNFVAIHAYGIPRLVDEEALRGILARSVRSYEGTAPDAWSIERLPEEFVAAQIKGIVGFEIPLARLEGKRKLSQNRSLEDRAGVARALGTADDSLARSVGEMMREALPEENP